MPTIGIKFETAAFVVLTVNASTPFVMLPSKDDTPTNTVSTIPKIHTTDVFMYFDNLLICTLSDILEIMFNATDIKLAGISTTFIKFPINVIINSIMGCSMLADTAFPSCYHKCY